VIHPITVSTSDSNSCAIASNEMKEYGKDKKETGRGRRGEKDAIDEGSSEGTQKPTRPILTRHVVGNITEAGF
jgi:hypothetical protein